MPWGLEQLGRVRVPAGASACSHRPLDVGSGGMGLRAAARLTSHETQSQFERRDAASRQNHIENHMPNIVLVAMSRSQEEPTQLCIFALRQPSKKADSTLLVTCILRRSPVECHGLVSRSDVPRMPFLTQWSCGLKTAGRAGRVGRAARNCRHVKSSSPEHGGYALLFSALPVLFRMIFLQLFSLQKWSEGSRRTLKMVAEAEWQQGKAFRKSLT